MEQRLYLDITTLGPPSGLRCCRFNILLTGTCVQARKHLLNAPSGFLSNLKWLYGFTLGNSKYHLQIGDYEPFPVLKNIVRIFAFPLS